MTEQPVPPNGDRHQCPLSACSWSLVMPPAPVVDEMALASVFGPGVIKLQAENQHRATIERELTEHLTTHSTLEFVTEIVQQQQLVLSLTAQLGEMGLLYGRAVAHGYEG